MALVRRRRPDVEYGPSLLVGAGLLTVPLGYGLQTVLVGRLTGSGAWAAGYLASLPLTGTFALVWRHWWVGPRGQWRRGWLVRRRPRLLAALQRERAAVVSALASAAISERVGPG